MNRWRRTLRGYETSGQSPKVSHGSDASCSLHRTENVFPSISPASRVLSLLTSCQPPSARSKAAPVISSPARSAAIAIVAFWSPLRHFTYAFFPSYCRNGETSTSPRKPWISLPQNLTRSTVQPAGGVTRTERRLADNSRIWQEAPGNSV